MRDISSRSRSFWGWSIDDTHAVSCPADSSSLGSIARALIAKPDVIFADEPTGNLDSQSGREVMDLLASVHREFGKTIVVITHDDRIAQMAERKFSIVDGHSLGGEPR